MKNILDVFPKERVPLPDTYQKIYQTHYLNNRNGKTKATFLSSKLESWMHRKVAQGAGKENFKTLEIGAGTLNQLEYESPLKGQYDIVEPFSVLYEQSPHAHKVKNIFEDMKDIPIGCFYDRITSIAAFEHITNLHEVVQKCCLLLNEKGTLQISIPNVGRFLWKFAYTMTTGLEFKKMYGLDYSVLMRYEHVNTADEIEALLRYYFEDVRVSLFGIGKMFSLYRFFSCTKPKLNPAQDAAHEA